MFQQLISSQGHTDATWDTAENHCMCIFYTIEYPYGI